MKSSEHFFDSNMRDSGEEYRAREEECDEKDASCLNRYKKKELLSE